jgi:predicted metalloprotease
MRWERGRRSSNVEDRRGARGRPVIAGGGLGFILLLLVAMYFGIDPTFLLQQAEMSQPQATLPSAGQGGEPGQPDPLADFVAVVLGDTEDTWNALFAEQGKRYAEPRLVLFTDQVRSACGFAQAAVGPFYCPADQKVYIDLGFYRDLRDRLGAPGDFAQAYVIAHEVGHHVQNLLGISDQVHSLQQRSGEREANALSVRLELQADCLAGVWANQAHRARNVLESGDVEEGLGAASAIGDDRLQREATGHVRPDSFTHGSSDQRVRWFRRGLESGDMSHCDTFTTDQL